MSATSEESRANLYCHREAAAWAPKPRELPVTLVTGIIFMVCVLVFRRGMIGELYASRLGKKLERRAED